MTVVNPGPIEDFVSTALMIVSNEKVILTQSISPILVPVPDLLEAHECRAFMIPLSRARVSRVVS